MVDIRFHFSFVLQQALSQCTWHHLCRQGVVCMEAARLHLDPEAAEAPESQQSSDELEERTGTLR